MGVSNEFKTRISLVEPEHAIWGSPRTDPDLAPDRIRDPGAIVGCVMHTTGYGAGLERLDRKLDDEAAIGLAFAHRQASILKYKPHFLVDRVGTTYQLCPLQYRAHHTGGGNRRSYAKAGWSDRKRKKLKWWHERFPGLSSPLDLPFWAPIKAGRRTVYSINHHSWAVDLLAPRPGNAYTDAQYRSLAELVVYVADLLGHPLDPHHVLDHSAVNPIDRSNGRGPWDFDARFDQGRFRELLGSESSPLAGSRDFGREVARV